MMLAQVLDQVVHYVSKEETREQLESKVLSPVMQYLAVKFSWGVRLFQVIAVLVFIQTLILLWLLFREMRRPPILTPAAFVA